MISPSCLVSTPRLGSFSSQRLADALGQVLEGLLPFCCGCGFLDVAAGGPPLLHRDQDVTS